MSDEGCDSSILKATLLDWEFDRESGFPFFFFFFNSSHVFDRARFTVSIFFFSFYFVSIIFIGRRVFVAFNVKWIIMTFVEIFFRFIFNIIIIMLCNVYKYIIFI